MINMHLVQWPFPFPNINVKSCIIIDTHAEKISCLNIQRMKPMPNKSLMRKFVFYFIVVDVTSLDHVGCFHIWSLTQDDKIEFNKLEKNLIRFTLITTTNMLNLRGVQGPQLDISYMSLCLRGVHAFLSLLVVHQLYIIHTFNPFLFFES